MSVRLGTGPVSWGVDFAEDDANPPWSEVLDEIARSGFRWTELGPLGYLPEDGQRLRDELERRQLEVAGSFVFQPLHEPSRTAEVLVATRATCELIREVGGRYLVVIDLIEPERVLTAGCVEVAPRLASSRQRELIEGIRKVATVARDEFALVPVLHPHVGTYIEFEHEIEAVLDGLEPELCELCVDTGHCAYAGIDPLGLVDRFRDRVGYLHLKDIDPMVRARALRERLDFWAAIEHGIFCSVGSGMVDFVGLERTLARVGFDGWATVEQDRDPKSGSDALEDVIAGREFLESVGFGDEKARAT